MENKKFIPEEEYMEILKKIPIVCVDLIVVSDNEFLLGKRVNKPAQGKWFVPGGRVLKDEKLLDTVQRKAKEEIGLDIDQEDPEFVTVGETIFKKEEDRHSVNVAYKITLENRDSISFDENQTSEVRWFSSIDDGWHPYVKHILKDAGFNK